MASRDRIKPMVIFRDGFGGPKTHALQCGEILDAPEWDLTFFFRISVNWRLNLERKTTMRRPNP